MSLESLLKPIQWADEQVLRYYTRKTEAWEEKGRSRYTLAQIYNGIASGANIVYLTLLGNYAGLPLLSVQVSEVARNMYEPRYKPDAATREKVLLPKQLELLRTIANYTRFPLFISGAALLVKGIIDMMTFAATRETEPLANALENLSLGYGMLGTASSMYIKDSDPKLLGKKPIEECMHQLELRPIPIEVRKD